MLAAASNVIRCWNTARGSGFVARSATMSVPGMCSGWKTRRATRSRRKFAAREMNVLGLAEGDRVERHVNRLSLIHI